MQSDQFEKAFGDYIDQKEYDAAESALFTIIRGAFSAGWNAAGGETPARPAPPEKGEKQ